MGQCAKSFSLPFFISRCPLFNLGLPWAHRDIMSVDYIYSLLSIIHMYNMNNSNKKNLTVQPFLTIRLIIIDLVCWHHFCDF